ncbi:hypothetical protein GCM10009665_04690 [Kitasatospora nipponensis]|uniref:Uncharacterized protein n=1 Tax=Kitasatospora nipponensis TaxID=258049 RepID=A0ABP4G938_9ACTN
MRVTPEEYWEKRWPVALELHDCWRSEESVVAVLRLLVSKLAPCDDPGATDFGVIGYLHDAFDMTLGEAKRLCRWSGLGGDLSDQEVEERTGTLVPHQQDYWLEP